MKEPIYQQLNQVLRGLVFSGEFAEGAKFLTERQVCERFGVSRATANKALSNLVAEGLLEFRKGIGTFVQHPPLDFDLRSLVSFTDKALAAGKRPTTRILRFETGPAQSTPGDIAKALGVRGPEELHYVERLRLADGVPVIFERRHIVAAMCPGLTAGQVQGSIYDVWTHEYGLEIAGADQTIRAHTLTAEEAGVLGVKGGTAALLVTSVGYTAGDAPLWHERTLYSGDSYEFRNRLGGVASTQPAAGRLRPGTATDTREGYRT